MENRETNDQALAVVLRPNGRIGGGAFVLAGVNVRIAGTLKVTFLDESFVTVGSTAEAVKHLASGG